MQTFQINKDLPRWLNYFAALCQTEDLDPVYCALQRSKASLGEDKVKRILVGMLCFYHLGTACQLAEVPSDQFWAKVQEIYPNAPRGTERRHFRGQQGIRSIGSMMAHGSPESLIDVLYADTYGKLRDNFKTHGVIGFGPYFQWKLLDFYDRILEQAIDPEDAWNYMPDEPRKGARLIAQEMGFEGKEDDFKFVTDYMIEEAGKAGIMAPPMRERLVNIQECETVLCQIQHEDWVGKDLKDKHGALEGWGDVAEEVKRNLHPMVPRNYYPDEWMVGFKKPVSTSMMEFFI